MLQTFCRMKTGQQMSFTLLGIQKSLTIAIYQSLVLQKSFCCLLGFNLNATLIIINFRQSIDVVQKCLTIRISSIQTLTKEACSQKIMLRGSFEGNVDLFLLQPFSLLQSRSSYMMSLYFMVGTSSTFMKACKCTIYKLLSVLYLCVPYSRFLLRGF